VETALLNLACALSRAIVYRELSIDSTQITRVVTAALDTLPSAAEQVSIHVNPADLEWTRQAAQRINPDSQVVPDDTVMPGGCRVDSRHSLVDFTVEKRFQKTIQQMLDRQLARAEGGESSGELDAVMGELTDFHRDVLEEAPETGIDSAQEGVTGVDRTQSASPDADDADEGHDQSD
jgi:flagellar assembly protein FliH